MANKNGKSTLPHVPNDHLRKRVEQMAAVGITIDDISAVLDISKNTLKKYYGDELKNAKTKADTMVAGKLYSKCMEGDTACLIFWAKTRMRWSEKHDVDLNIKTPQIIDNIPPRKEK